MRTDNSAPLASVQEIAAFAWSLTELLFTRVLPLLGFLVTQLVLQTGRTALAIVTAPLPSQSPRTPRRRSPWLTDEQQQQPWETYGYGDYLPYANSTQFGYSSSTYYDSSSPQIGVAPHYSGLEHSTPQLDAARPETSDDSDELPQLIESSDAPDDSAQPELPATQPSIVAPSEKEQPQHPPAEASTGIVEPPAADSSNDEHMVEPHADPALPKASETLVTAAAAADGQQQQGDDAAAGAGAPVAVKSSPSDASAMHDSPKMTPDAKKENDVAKRESSSSGHVAGGDWREEAKGEKRHGSTLGRSGSLRRTITRRMSGSGFAKVLPSSLSQLKRTLTPRSKPSKTVSF